MTFVLLVVTFSQLGPLPTQPPKVLPAGVIGLVGWANRLLVVLFCMWTATVAWQAIMLSHERRSVLAVPQGPRPGPPEARSRRPGRRGGIHRSARGGGATPATPPQTGDPAADSRLRQPW